MITVSPNRIWTAIVRDILGCFFGWLPWHVKSRLRFYSRIGWVEIPTGIRGVLASDEGRAAA